MFTFRALLLFAMFAFNEASVYNKPKAELVKVGRAAKGFHYFIRSNIDIERDLNATKTIFNFVKDINLNLNQNHVRGAFAIIAYQLKKEKEDRLMELETLKETQRFNNDKSNDKSFGSASYPIYETLEEHLSENKEVGHNLIYTKPLENPNSMEKVRQVLSSLKWETVVNKLESFQILKTLIKDIQDKEDCLKDIFQTLVASKKLNQCINKLSDINGAKSDLQKLANNNNHSILIQEIDDVYQSAATFITSPNGKVQIEVTLNAKEDKNYNLYIPVLPPMSIFGGKGYILHQSDYVIGKYVNIESHKSKEHIVLSKDILNSAPVYDQIHIIFEEFNAISDSDIFSNSCEDHLDQSLPKEAASLCTFEVVPNTNHVYRLSDTMFGIVTNSYEEAAMQCGGKNGTTSTPIELKIGMTIINLEHTCQLEREGGFIRPSTRLPKQAQEHHLPLKLGFMDQLQNELEKKLHGFQFMHTTLVTPIDLKSLEYTLANDTRQKMNFFVSITIAVICSVILSVFGTLIIVYCCKCCKKTKEMQNNDPERGNQESQVFNSSMEIPQSSSSSDDHRGFETQSNSSFAQAIILRELTNI